MDYEVELDDQPGRGQHEESLTVRYPDGRSETMRLHEYDRVYAIPGLYEEVVHNRLKCDSPRVLADTLVTACERAGDDPARLRAFDLGAGNGVMGEEVAGRGVKVVVGSDDSAPARDAAQRDRPGLYEEYLVGDVDDLDDLEGLVREHRLNTIICAASLGMGHITAESFERLWAPFPAGSWFAVTLADANAEPGGSDFGDYLARLRGGGDDTEILADEPFRHRLTMAGEPIGYRAVVARKGLPKLAR